MSHRSSAALVPASRSRLARFASTVAAIPEVAVAVALFGVLRDRFTGEDGDRGDVIQWVLVTAFGAIIAAAVGAVVYSKLKSKASSITLTTNP